LRDIYAARIGRATAAAAFAATSVERFQFLAEGMHHPTVIVAAGGATANLHTI